MRIITLIVVHCSAVRPDQTSSAAQIDSWHRKQGWKLGIGYHYVIRRNGDLELGRPEYMVGAHCQNHNAHSIGVCYEGGLDIRGQPADTRTMAQKVTLRLLLEDLHRRFPGAKIVGHHDLNPHKDCPCIPDVAREYADIQWGFQLCGRRTIRRKSQFEVRNKRHWTIGNRICPQG